MFPRLPGALAVLLLLGLGVVRAVNPEPGTVPPPTCPTCDNGEDNDSHDEDTSSGSGGCTQCDSAGSESTGGTCSADDGGDGGGSGGDGSGGGGPDGGGSGSPTTDEGQPDLSHTVSLGKVVGLNEGLESAGTFKFEVSGSPDDGGLLTPPTVSGVQYGQPKGAEIIGVNGATGAAAVVKQVLTQEALADIQTTGDGYTLNLYAKSQVGAKIGGVYAVSGTPLKTVTYFNPGGGANTHSFAAVSVDNTGAAPVTRTLFWSKTADTSDANHFYLDASQFKGDTRLGGAQLVARTTLDRTLLGGASQNFTQAKTVQKITAGGALATLGTASETYAYYTGKGACADTAGHVRRDDDEELCHRQQQREFWEVADCFDGRRRVEERELLHLDSRVSDDDGGERLCRERRWPGRDDDAGPSEPDVLFQGDQNRRDGGGQRAEGPVARRRCGEDDQVSDRRRGDGDADGDLPCIGDRDWRGAREQHQLL